MIIIMIDNNNKRKIKYLFLEKLSNGIEEVVE